MTRQQYRSALRDIDKRLKKLDLLQEHCMIKRAIAGDSKDKIEEEDNKLKDIAHEAQYLFRLRRKVVESWLNRLTSRPSVQPKDTPVCHRDEQTRERHED